MTKKIQLSGLCINCLNSDECKYRLSHTRPIVFCEEFTCTDPLETNNTIAMVIEKADLPRESTSKGLCSNCENVVTCNIQQTNGNVINCEEYR